MKQMKCISRKKCPEKMDNGLGRNVRYGEGLMGRNVLRRVSRGKCTQKELQRRTIVLLYSNVEKKSLM